MTTELTPTLALAALIGEDFQIKGGTPTFDAAGYIAECIDGLPTDVPYYYGTYSFDGGALGELELELDAVDLDLCDIVGDNWCGNAPDADEYLSGGAAVTLAGVREAWMAHHKRGMEDYLWAVVTEVMNAKANGEAKVGLELVEAEQQRTAQAVQDRDKAQTLYGKAHRNLAALREDLAWAAGILGDAPYDRGRLRQERAARIKGTLEQLAQMEAEANTPDTTPDTTPTDEAQA